MNICMIRHSVSGKSGLFIVLIMCCFSIVNAENLSDFEVLRGKFDNWLVNIKDNIPIISSRYVNDSVVKDWDFNQENYQIISVRSLDAYTSKGHISQAINIPYEKMLTEDNLEKLDDMKLQVIYSDNGYRSTTVSTILALLDYESYSMKFGMMDWNNSQVVNRVVMQKANLKIEKGQDTSKATFHYPSLKSTGKPVNDLIKQRFNEELATKQIIISVNDVKRIVDRWDKFKDSYQIVSLRNKKDFVAGHIPHAINIPWFDLMHGDQLKRIDPDKTTIVYCYTGHLAQISVTLLNIIGYNAVNMRFGMMGWNRHYVRKKVVWDGEASYPVTTGIVAQCVEAAKC
jgi:rhodanese-related sulfurtransferase